MNVLLQQNDSSKFYLYSINIMLQTIGERPINDDVELADILEAQIAASVLIETTKEVLAMGWDFNTDTGYSFAQDVNGYISIPSNVLNLSSSDGDLIVRDWRLYSKSNKTAKFETPQEVDVVWDMDFNTISHPIRTFITLRATRKFMSRQVMDGNVYGFTQKDEEDAYISARNSESFTARYNLLNSSFASDNFVR